MKTHVPRTMTTCQTSLVALFVAASCFAGIADDGSTTMPDVLSAAILKTKADIDAETVALNTLRADIAAERLPRANALASLRAEVSKLREAAEALRQRHRRTEEEHLRVRNEVTTKTEECRALLDVLSEHARDIEMRTGPAYAGSLSSALKPIHEQFSKIAGDDDFAGLASTASSLFTLSEKWNRARSGIDVFDGIAFDENGLEHRGKFAAIGPVAYFLSDSHELAGLATTSPGSVLPVVVALPRTDAREAIGKILSGVEADLPVDVTSGNALKVAGTKESLSEHLRKGGFVMIPLLALGAFALLITCLKTVSLLIMRNRLARESEVALRLTIECPADGMADSAKNLHEPFKSLVSTARRYRGKSREQVEEVMHEHVLEILPKLERHLGTLAVLGGVAPLLGLLGTVTGMIHTFQLVTLFGTGDAKLLSGGISEALITTEAGLFIAIPVLLVHAFLVRQTRGILAEIERAALSLVNTIQATP